MKLKCSLSVICLLGWNVLAIAQTSPPLGSKTFSPYTPAQLKALNSISLTPVEGPFGATTLNGRPVTSAHSSSKYFSAPEGEEEAEALETESADPYTPMSSVMTF